MRQSGYYWVKYEGQWYVAWYKMKMFSFPHWYLSKANGFHDSDFEEIDERRIERERYTLGIKTFDSEGKEIK